MNAVSFNPLIKRSAILIALIFIARALALQCIYPPLEGSDEYQHLAVMQYIREHHGLPVLNDAVVPVSLYPHLRQLPHCHYDWQQTRFIGCREYKTFYDSPPEQTPKNPPIPLYQAQHPPLYYIAMLPIYSVSCDWFGFAPTIYLLRIINILFGACAMLLLLSPLLRLGFSHGLKQIIAVTVVVSPLFAVYVSRVSNDAMALMLAAAGIALVCRIDLHHRPSRTALVAGICLGFGTVTKLIVFGFLPASVLALPLLLWRRVSVRKILWSFLMLMAGYLLIALPYHIWAMKTYGVIFPAQETIRNHSNGISLLELFESAQLDHLRVFFFHRLCIGTLWRSGWSFLLPDGLFESIYSLYFRLAMVGVVIWPIVWVLRGKKEGQALQSVAKKEGQALQGGAKKKGQALQSVAEKEGQACSKHLWIYCGLLIGSSYSAAYVHGLSCIRAHGAILTPSYYVMPVFPLVIICLAGIFSVFGRRMVNAIMGSMAVLFCIAEIHSLVRIAIPHWAGTYDLGLAFQRLNQFQPFFLSIYLMPLFCVGAGVCLALLFRKSG